MQLVIIQASKFLYHNVLSSKIPSQKPPIVCCHGLLGRKENMRSFCKSLYNKLGEEYDLIAVDLRCHGGSRDMDLEGNGFDYKALASDLIFTLEKLNIKKAHFVGHSMGGKAIAAAALLSTTGGLAGKMDIYSSTIMDISPIRYSEENFKNVLQTLDFLEMNCVTEAISKKQYIEDVINEHFEDQNVRLFLQSSLIEEEDNVCWRFDIQGILQSRDAILDWPFDYNNESLKWEKPVLLLKGANSDFIKTSHLPQVGQQFPLYTLQSIGDAGHDIHAEQVEATTDAVSSFIIKAEEYCKSKGLVNID
jgi:esterase